MNAIGFDWTVPVLKLTVLLLAAWFAEAVLLKANPRWRVLVWRCAAMGVILLAALASVPPVLRVPILPTATTSNIHSAAPYSLNVAASRPDPFIPANRTQYQVNPGALTYMPAGETSSARPQDSAVPRLTPTTNNNRNWSTANYIAAVYVVGIIALVARLALGAYHIWRIVSSSKTAPDFANVEAAKVAASLGVRRSFRLRESGAIQTPCLVGMFRPTILLPPVQCDAANAAELPAILAHELAHLRGRDLWWNSLLNTLFVFIWPHPLAWRARRAHTNACDQVADAIAADYVGDAKEYGSTLARLALRMRCPWSTAGLAMARPSTTRQRVEAIQRHVFSYALPRRKARLVLIAASCCAVLLGSVVITRSVAEAPKKESSTDDSKFSRMEIHAVAEKSGEPLADLVIEGAVSVEGKKRAKLQVTTGADGRGELKWETGGRVTELWFTAKRPGFAPINYWWMDDRQVIELPPTLDLSFKPGVKAGGIVSDELGRPISDASVELSMPLTWPRSVSHILTFARLKTDSEGKWSFDGVPEDRGSVSIRVKHPDYLPAMVGLALNIDHVTVLKQGLRVEGDIVDNDSTPIKGALAALGFDRFGSDDPDAKTDANGHFILKNCKPGKSLVTVQADGFCPQAKEVHVGEQSEPLKFVLEPGHMMRVRVVDVAGNPLKGVWMGADTWGNYRSLKFRRDTPEDGRVDWNGAPAEAVLYDFGKQGYMASRRISIKPDGDEHVVTLYPILQISGSVKEKGTRKPVANFEVTHGFQFAGNPQMFWDRGEGIKGADGTYSYQFDEPQQGYVLRVEAAGYLPATSRIFTTTEGKVAYDFELEPGAGPQGVVLLPNGQPAVGAKVALSSEQKRAFLKLGRFDQHQNQADIVETDAEGKFTFLPQDTSTFDLIALHDEGFAMGPGIPAGGNELKLVAWGRVEGKAFRGQQPDAGREVSFQPRRNIPNNGFGNVFCYGYEGRTNEDGRFVFERVIPGSGDISRVVITEIGRSQQHAPGWTQNIDVRPGDTTTVTLGGTGRAVTGQIVLDRDPPFDLDWTQNEPVSIQPAAKVIPGALTPVPAFNRYLANIDQTGRFEVPDVPAGDYKLIVNVNSPAVPNTCGAGAAAGNAELEFTIPEMAGGRSDEPLDLGTVKATLFDTLDVGEMAPDFVADRIGGGSVHFVDYRGKLVLVDFWAMWCGPCVAEMPNLKEIQKSFGNDPRFVMLGISCDYDPAATGAFVAANGLDWQQVNIGNIAAQTAKDYGVRAIPATFLIGPDGRVLSKDLRGEELKKAVAAALANDKLFDAK